MTALIFLVLNLAASLFKPRWRLEAENAALRQQLIVVQRKVRGRVEVTNSDRLFFIQLVSLVSIHPQSHHDLPPRDGRGLAPCWFSPLLALESNCIRCPWRIRKSSQNGSGCRKNGRLANSGAFSPRVVRDVF